MGYGLVMTMMVIAMVAVVLWLRWDLDRQAGAEEISEPEPPAPAADAMAAGTLDDVVTHQTTTEDDDGRPRTGFPEEAAR